MRRMLVALASGLLFAVGLALSGMTRPSNVRAFLDVAGGWDPRLALVLASAVAVYAWAYRWSRTLSGPLLGDAFAGPSALRVDRRLVLGAIVFGGGWGLSGYCPGPALTSLGAGVLPAIWFVAAMFAGMLITRWGEAIIRRRRAHRATARAVALSSASEVGG